MTFPLITPHALASHLHDPQWIIIDCRFDLLQPDWGRADYLKGHIPGAIYADLDQDLAGEITPESGRHPLPSIQQLTRLFSSWGAAPDKKFVVYDTQGGAFAARAWFLLRLCGYEEVYLLDGAYRNWLHAISEYESGPASAITVGSLTPVSLTENWIVSSQQVFDGLAQRTHFLLDARSPIRFLGLQEPIDPVAGHIPGAHNRFHLNNLTQSGVFKSPDQLNAEFRQLLGSTPPQQVIVYCGSGVTSCHHLVAMQAAGLPGTRIYLGSWSEWIRDPRRPIQTGL